MQFRNLVAFILFDSVVHPSIEILVEFVVLVLFLVSPCFLLSYVVLMCPFHLLLLVLFRLLNVLVILYCILQVISVLRNGVSSLFSCLPLIGHFLLMPSLFHLLLKLSLIVGQLLSADHVLLITVSQILLQLLVLELGLVIHGFGIESILVHSLVLLGFFHAIQVRAFLLLPHLLV